MGWFATRSCCAVQRQLVIERILVSVANRLNGLKWREDFGPSIVVLLISIPLSMGIAIASGVPPARGLITAIVGGLIIGSLAGSKLQVSGPSAGLAIMVLEVVHSYGLKGLAVVVPIMGAVQALAGLLKLGPLFRAVSPAVINGMLAGIGFLIFCAQFHVVVDDSPKGSGLDNLFSIPEAIYKGALTFDGSVHNHAAVIGILTLVILVGATALKNTVVGRIPSALLAVGGATAANAILGWDIQRVDMPSSFVDSLAFPDFAVIGELMSPGIVISGITLAFVASAETLLCATAVDAMHDGDRTDYNQELFAQGIGNIFCGVLGAPPTTGVITRSTANVQAGATSPASAIMLGAWLLLIMLLVPGAFNVVPTASLAALLVYIGYKLVRFRPYAELRAHGRSELFIFAATVTIIVSVNLLAGIITGLVLATLKLALSGGKQFHRFSIEKSDEGNTTHVHLSGAASFLRLPRLATALESIDRGREVHLHISKLDYIDHACLDLIDRWECGRIAARSPVRVEWQTLRHRYHDRNRLDPSPEQHKDAPEGDFCLLDFIKKDNILVDASFENKWQAIEELSTELAERIGASASDLEVTVKEREHSASTYLGRGLLMPHGSLPDDSEMAGVVALSKEGWDFPSVSDKVHCIVLLATPASDASRHLAVLAGFARIFSAESGVREALVQSSSAEEAFAVLSGEDSKTVQFRFESKTQKRA